MNRVSPTLSSARLVPALLTLVVLLAGCSNSSADPDPSPVPVDPEAPALSLVPFDNPTVGRGVTLQGCGSVADREDGGWTIPVLVWTRLRVAERVRLLPSTIGERSSGVDSITQYVGPDPGRAAPNQAISIGAPGAGPTSERLTYDTHVIGDQRDTPAGLKAARASWKARAPLDEATTLEPGDHYLFTEVDPARGMNLRGLTVRWTHDGEPGEQTIGGISLRAQCGG